MRRIEFPNMWITVMHFSCGLITGFGTFMIAPEAWGLYSVVVPGITILGWLESCNVKWSVSKKYSIIKYISVMSLMMITISIGKYLTAN
jgi:hypothetical protein